MEVSIVASAVRPKLWDSFLSSLKGTDVEHEVVFVGHCIKEEVEPFIEKYSFFRYIHTAAIKPSQCYFIALNSAKGETILYTADDAESPNNVVGKAYKYWKSNGNEKLILSIQTKESGYNLPIGQLFDMNLHRFYGGNRRTPLMAPLGLISNRFYKELGGIDCRYVSGQWENDLVMRACAKGATVEIFGNHKCFIDIDHLGKSIMIGESTNQNDFRNRPFATGYTKDREVLEGSWKQTQQGTFIRADEFEPYEDKDILTVSQSNKGKWI